MSSYTTLFNNGLTSTRYNVSTGCRFTLILIKNNLSVFLQVFVLFKYCLVTHNIKLWLFVMYLETQGCHVFCWLSFFNQAQNSYNNLIIQYFYIKNSNTMNDLAPLTSCDKCHQHNQLLGYIFDM